VDPKK